MSIVYLIHFDKPFKHAQHYIGVTNENDVFKRFDRHRNSNGANICAKAIAAGVSLSIARIWYDVPRKSELKLKALGGAKDICPMCSGQKAFNRGIIK